MSNKIKISLVLILAILGVSFYLTPYLALMNMKSAIQERDAEKLAGYVDFPAVKESLKASLMTKIAGEIQKEPGNDPLAALGEKLASAFVGQVVDSIVTPEGLGMLLEGRKPGSRKQEGSGDSDKSSNINKSMSYESFNRFVVSITKKEGRDHLDFVLHRDGLFSWKLAEIRM